MRWPAWFCRLELDCKLLGQNSSLGKGDFHSLSVKKCGNIKLLVRMDEYYHHDNPKCCKKNAENNLFGHQVGL